MSAAGGEKFAPLNLAPDELIDYTPEWTGARDAAGRPLVPDAILERMRAVTITQAWGVLQGAGLGWANGHESSAARWPGREGAGGAIVWLTLGYRQAAVGPGGSP